MSYANDCHTINKLCGVVDTITEEQDNLQGQLADVVSLLRKIERRIYGEDVEHRFTDLLPDLDRITAQAEQQEASCPSCDVHRPDGEWLGEYPCAEAQEAQGEQPSEFQREDRYIVIKRKDLDQLPMEIRLPFSMALNELAPRLPKREYLAIESDWPEYKPAWAAIQARVTGQDAQAGDYVPEELLRPGALVNEIDRAVQPVTGDERAAFEDWYRRTLSPGATFNKNPDGSYESGNCQGRWLTWKARADLAAQPALPEVQ